MKKYIKSFAIIIILVFANIGFAQDTYTLKDTKDVDIKLLGTSTLHDWEMNASNATGAAQFIVNEVDATKLKSLKTLTFNLLVKDLQSDSKALDKNAYKALKTDDFKDINYVLSSSTLIPDNEGYLLKSKGKLTIAGVTKDINMDILITVNDDNTISCKGVYILKMTDYNVEPPSFMMGLMTTGDDATLDFDVTYALNDNQ
ncbi:YceI-like domain-containing protein [Flavobacteriaceae bacterium MAR_2010_188]|nr:YceI-like domain-containing protein [Flavobacteriaceae bacterium MAR_2010_188]